MKDLEIKQIEICRKYKAEYEPLNWDMKVGISKNFSSGVLPLNGLRNPPEKNTCGWYLWAGEEFSKDADFFQPMHAYHLIKEYPQIVSYLGLPPGWRFLVAEEYEDVWFDIKSFIPTPDAVETHSIEIAASRETVYQALWTADLGGSPIIKGLMFLRSLPSFILHPKSERGANRKITLQTLIDSGFGRLAEEPGKEIVLGIAGRFWRPSGNVMPFSRKNFIGETPAGLARAVWNFTVRESRSGGTILTTETRVICGGKSSRLKFRAYWFFVRPFSGLIRIVMLRSVKRECEGIP